MQLANDGLSASVDLERRMSQEAFSFLFVCRTQCPRYTCHTASAVEGSVMKYAILVARILLGLAFVAAGTMNILHLKQQAMPGDGGLLLSILSTHGYMTVIALIMLVGGLLLLVGRFIPLGLTLLGPVIFNILLFHIFFAPSGLIAAVVIVALEVFLIVVYRRAFLGIFAANPDALGSARL